jgi:hypothetical protein
MNGFNQHPWVFWFVSGLSVIAAVGAAGAVGMFVVGLALTWRSQWIASLKARRGFEVKLTPGTMPGLIEEKEE